MEHEYEDAREFLPTTFSLVPGESSKFRADVMGNAKVVPSAEWYAITPEDIGGVWIFDEATDDNRKVTLKQALDNAVMGFKPVSLKEMTEAGWMSRAEAEETLEVWVAAYGTRDEDLWEKPMTLAEIRCIAARGDWIPFSVVLVRPWMAYAEARYQLSHEGRSSKVSLATEFKYLDALGGNGMTFYHEFPENVDLRERVRHSLVAVVTPPTATPRIKATLKLDLSNDRDILGDEFIEKYRACVVKGYDRIDYPRIDIAFRGWSVVDRKDGKRLVQRGSVAHAPYVET